MKIVGKHLYVTSSMSVTGSILDKSIVSSSTQTINNLNGTSIVSSSTQTLNNLNGTSIVSSSTQTINNLNGSTILSGSVVSSSYSVTSSFAISSSYVSWSQISERPIQARNITIETPSNSENISLWVRVPQAITIIEINTVLRGSSSPTVQWNLRHGTDRSATGTQVVTAGITSSNTTTGGIIQTFNNPNVASASHLWITTGGTSGTVDEMSVTVTYRV